MRVIQPSWSTYHMVTGSVELSIQLSRSMPYGSGSTYSVNRAHRGLAAPHPMDRLSPYG